MGRRAIAMGVYMSAAADSAPCPYSKPGRPRARRQGEPESGSSTTSFKTGDSVCFRPRRKATVDVIAKVNGQDGHTLVTKDEDGKVRRIRLGSCRAA